MCACVCVCVCRIRDFRCMCASIGRGRTRGIFEGLSMCAYVGGLGVPVSVGTCRCIE